MMRLLLDTKALIWWHDHKDPFDRLLIAQAIHENMTLISNDPKFPPYPVTLLW